MQISGNVSSQISSAQSLKSSDQAAQTKRQDASKSQDVLLAQQAAQQAQTIRQNNDFSSNQPTPGASVGSIINTSA